MTKWNQKKSSELVAEAKQLEISGLSRRGIAEKLNVSKGTIKNWLDPLCQTSEHKTKQNRRRQDLRNHKYKTDLSYNIKQRLRIAKARADRCGYVACSTPPDKIMMSFTGSCECCERHEDDCGTLCIDHCHSEPGRFRAWLCHDCNRAIGLLQEDPKIIQKVLDLVKRYL